MKMKNTQYWKITPGQEGFLWREQKLNECIAIGWTEIKKVKIGITEEELSRKRCDGRFLSPQSVNQIYNFVNKIRKGDKVIASTSGKGIYAIGTIVGDYNFNDKLEYKHSRKVQWETTFWSPVKIGELKLSEKLQNKFHGRSSQTIRKLSEEEWREFSKQLSKVSTPFRNLGMWGGMVQAPEYESEVIILFSHMLQHFHMRIIKSGPFFPDAVVERKRGRKWEKLNIEFELHSSSFRKHLPDKEGKCDLIVCWEDDDWGRDNHQKRRYKDKIIELKKDLEKIL
jgi:hypothetical protein